MSRTPEESEDEYTNNDKLDNLELQHFTIEGLGPAIRIVKLIALIYEEAFPVIQGKRRLYLQQFN